MRLPARVALAMIVCFAPQAKDGTTIGVAVQFKQRTATEIGPKVVLGVASRTTLGTVPGAVPGVVPGASILACIGASNLSISGRLCHPHVRPTDICVPRRVESGVVWGRLVFDCEHVAGVVVGPEFDEGLIRVNRDR